MIMNRQAQMLNLKSRLRKLLPKSLVRSKYQMMKLHLQAQMLNLRSRLRSRLRSKYQILSRKVLIQTKIKHNIISKDGHKSK